VTVCMMGARCLDFDEPLTSFGILLILIGIAFVLIPILTRIFPEIDLEKVPWFLLYVYRSDGFVFATSPLLITLGTAFFLWNYLHR
jgi:hypothetical protein